MERLFSQRLIKERTWWRNDGARRQENGNGNFVQMGRKFPFKPDGTEKLE